MRENMYLIEIIRIIAEGDEDFEKNVEREAIDVVGVAIYVAIYLDFDGGHFRLEGIHDRLEVLRTSSWLRNAALFIICVAPLT